MITRVCLNRKAQAQMALTEACHIFRIWCLGNFQEAGVSFSLRLICGLQFPPAATYKVCLLGQRILCVLCVYAVAQLCPTLCDPIDCSPETKLPTSVGSLKEQENSRKTSTSALLIMPKPLTVCITTNCGKFFKRWEYQTT